MANAESFPSPSAPRRGQRVWLSGLALGALLSLPLPAAAFCRTTTVPVSADFNPRPGVCWTRGVPLWWRNACISYNINRLGSRQIAYDDASSVIARGFSQWSSVSCPAASGGRSGPSIDLRDLGGVECNKVEYNSTGGNQHVIVFRDDNWPHNDSNNTLALTTVTFNPDTGEIYDADMEINTAGTRMSLSDTVPDQGYDFASVITHEAGHFLGLAHSGDSRSTMYSRYNPGSTLMRNLATDDVQGICEVYRPDGTRAVATTVDAKGVVAAEACDPTPRKGFSRACGGTSQGTNSNSSGGCSLANLGSVPAAGREGMAALGLLGATLASTGLRRRRRGATSPRSKG